MSRVDRKSLLDLLDRRLGAEDVGDLVFELGLEEANLEGATKRARLRSLIDYYERRDQMEHLIATITALRPDILAPDTVYVTSPIEAPPPRWRLSNWRRAALASVAIAVVLATAGIGAQWYRSRPHDAPSPPSLTPAIEQSPQDAAALFDRGERHRDQGEYRLAIADYTQVTMLRPYYAGAWSRLGLCYEVVGDDDLAIENYSKAIELQAGSWDFLSRGALYFKRGDLDRAIHDFSESVRLEPGLTRAWYARGYAYRQAKQNDKAIADFQKVVDLNDAYWRGQAEEQLKVLEAR